MPNDTTPDAGKNVNPTPDAGKNVETPDVSKLVADAVSPLLAQIEGLAKTVNGLAAEKRRASEEPKKADSKAIDPEVATLHETVKKLTDRSEAAEKRIALKDALDQIGSQIVPTAREDIEQLVANSLDFDSTGKVVALVNGKHVPLADHVKAIAEKPHFKAATGKQGVGKPGSGETASGSKKIQLNRNDLAAKARYVNEIARGEVEFVD